MKKQIIGISIFLSIFLVNNTVLADSPKPLPALPSLPSLDAELSPPPLLTLENVVSQDSQPPALPKLPDIEMPLPEIPQEIADVEEPEAELPALPELDAELSEVKIDLPEIEEVEIPQEIADIEVIDSELAELVDLDVKVPEKQLNIIDRIALAKSQNIELNDAEKAIAKKLETATSEQKQELIDFFDAMDAIAIKKSDKKLSEPKEIPEDVANVEIDEPELPELTEMDVELPEIEEIEEVEETEIPTEVVDVEVVKPEIMALVEPEMPEIPVLENSKIATKVVEQPSDDVITDDQRRKLEAAGINVSELNLDDIVKDEALTDSSQKRVSSINKRVNKRVYQAIKDNDNNIPSFMYKREYSKVNGHLPKVIYRSDLENYLIAAAAAGDFDLLRTMLDVNVDINAANNSGNTALMAAILNDNTQIVRLLLLRGADVDLANKQGVTPLHVALDNNRYRIIEDLIYKGADVNLASNNGTTPLMRAAIANNFKAFKLLVEARADVKAVTSSGATATHIASQVGNFEMVKLLLEKGAVPNLMTKNGVMAEHLAVGGGHFKVASLLSEYTAEIIRKREEALRKERERLFKEEQERKRIAMEKERKRRAKITRLMSKPFDPNMRYQNVSKIEQEVWDERFANWVKVDKNFSSLSLDEKYEWNSRRKDLQSIYKGVFEQKISSVGGNSAASIARWNEVDITIEKEKIAKDGRRKKLAEIINNWKDVDNQFSMFSIDEKIAANNLRAQLQVKIFGDKGQGELFDVFNELPEYDRNALRASMKKWDTFERDIKGRQSIKQFPRRNKRSDVTIEKKNNNSSYGKIAPSAGKMIATDVGNSSSNEARLGSLRQQQRVIQREIKYLNQNTQDREFVPNVRRDLSKLRRTKQSGVEDKMAYTNRQAYYYNQSVINKLADLF